ncbi:MAG: LysR family transcriptional regulator [Saccharospirillaceae bacterium]|nr:LysR family transcriptional regulator [Saccharospirillaceae bacterium]
MFKIDTLVAFDLVAEHGSFTAAAQAHGQTSMAMSKQVSKLETQLAQALFERTTRTLTLTSFGRNFREKAQQVIGQHEALMLWSNGQQDEVTGELRIVAQYSEFYQETVFPWLDEFHEKYPKLTLKFDIQENMIELKQDVCDIFWGVGEYLGVKYGGLKSRSLWRSRCGVFASPKYLARYGTPKTPDDLDGHKIIGYLHNKPDNLLLLYKADETGVKQPHYVPLQTVVSTVTGQIEMAASGLGLINAGDDVYKVKEFVAQNKLKPILMDYWLPNAEVFVYYHQTSQQQKSVRAFIDFFISKREQWL